MSESVLAMLMISALMMIAMMMMLIGGHESSVKCEGKVSAKQSGNDNRADLSDNSSRGGEASGRAVLHTVRGCLTHTRVDGRQWCTYTRPVRTAAAPPSWLEDPTRDATPSYLDWCVSCLRALCRRACTRASGSRLVSSAFRPNGIRIL